MNNFDLEELFDTLNKKHFSGVINKIPVEWNLRLRTTAGKCVYTRMRINGSVEYKPTRIELSKKLFKNNNIDLEKIRRTLIHEMTHAFMLQVHNEPGHTPRFHLIMSRITGEFGNHRCHNYNVKGLRNKRNVAYWCPCGLTEGMRARMPKAGLVYRAKCCKGIVEFKKMDNKSDNFWDIQ